ncbi:hypothetical protein [Conchiformibius kuhniae]|uniref:Uncharacterized protein n=1 Tax=Conchiformibius kuhniae TaxID=211502 RepID=A0A8T9MVH5_9NEIS|nr:hypothetical protein [Conchiformibius kuhniae]
MRETDGNAGGRVGLWLVLLLLLLGAAAFAAWRLVDALGEGAANISSQVKQAKPMPDVNTETLSQVSGALPPPDWHVAENVSSGTDLAVQKGEFLYRDGRPVVRLALYNQGGFAISAAKISLSLLLDGEESPFARAEALDIPFDGRVLLPGESLIADLAVEDETWLDEAVRSAAQRRVLAQVVFVNDADRDNIDYPQTGAGVYLKQVGEDWGGAPAQQAWDAASEAEEDGATADAEPIIKEQP